MFDTSPLISSGHKVANIYKQLKKIRCNYDIKSHNKSISAI